VRKLLFILLLFSYAAHGQHSVIRARTYPYASSLGFVPVTYDSAGYALIFHVPVSSLSGAGGGGEAVITAPFTAGKYWNGYKSWGSLITDSITEGTKLFFTNARVTTVGDARYALLSHTHAIADVTGLQSALNAKQATITTGTTLQYLRGDLSLATFPTAISTFTNDAGYLTGNQSITLSGDITGTGGTAITTTIGAGKVTNGMLAGSIAISKLSTTGTPSTTTYLRGDGQWTTPSTVWGGITGTLSNQTDLQTALNAKQPQLSGTGFVKATGTTITYDNSTYLTTNQSITLSGDLSGSGSTAISGTVSGIKGVAVPALASGFLKYNGTAWTFDNSTYLTANQSISFAPTGDVTGSTSGTTSLAPALTIGARKVLYSMMPSVTDARLLGRSAGSAGDAMEISVGSGLTLSGGILSATTLNKQNSLLSNATSTVATNTNSNLSFSAAANEVWVIEFDWTAQCSSTGGSKFQITAPTGSTIEGFYQGTTSAITTLTYQRITAINTLTGTAAHTVATTPAPDRIIVRVKVSSTAGTIALGFASVTAGQTTTIFAGASMIAYKVTEL
jgi:hypothetical protein